MPATPYAKILISVNAGPTQSGGITVLNGDTIQLTAESTAQWPSTPAPRWEIYSYTDHPNFPVPAGWTDVDGVYTYLGIGPPPSFTVPALPWWGKMLFRLTIGGGLLNGIQAAQMVDTASGLKVISPNLLVSLTYQETNQFDADEQWAADYHNNLVVLDNNLATGANLSNNVAQPVSLTAGSAGVNTEASRDDHVHFLATAAPGSILIGDASSAGVAASVARSDHVHAFAAPAAPVDVTKAAASAGASTAAARADHKHDVSTAVVTDVGLANAEGAATSLARSDHVHRLTFATVNAVLATASTKIDINSQDIDPCGSILFGDAITPVVRQNQSGTGAGNTLTIEAQQGLGAGDVGGTLVVSGGPGGTGADAYGAVEVQLGSVGGTSSKLALKYGASRFSEFYRTTHTNWYVDQGIRIGLIGGAHVLTIFGGNTAIEAGTSLGAWSIRGEDDTTVGTANTLTVRAANATGVGSTGGDTIIGGSTGVLKNGNIGLGAAVSAGGGGRVLFVANATTAPTSFPTGGVLLHVADNADVLTPSKTTTTVAPKLTTGVATTDVLLTPHRECGKAQTVGAVSANIIDYALSDNTVTHVKAYVTGRDGATGDSATYDLRQGFKRHAGGAATAIGTIVVDTFEDDATWDATLVVSGNNVRVRVTGGVGDTVEWSCTFETYLHTPPP